MHCSQSLGNTLKLRVGQFSFNVKIRQVCVNHLNRGYEIHLHTILLGKIIQELREYRAMSTICANSKEIIGLERGTGNEVLDDGRRQKAIYRADEPDFLCFVIRMLIMYLLRDAQKRGFFTAYLPCGVKAVACSREIENQTLDFLLIIFC